LSELESKEEEKEEEFESGRRRRRGSVRPLCNYETNCVLGESCAHSGTLGVSADPKIRIFPRTLP
jgi:hypothetical protein